MLCRKLHYQTIFMLIPFSYQLWRAALNKELVRLGLGEDALGLQDAPLSSCGHCKVPYTKIRAITTRYGLHA